VWKERLTGLLQSMQETEVPIPERKKPYARLLENFATWMEDNRNEDNAARSSRRFRDAVAGEAVSALAQAPGPYHHLTFVTTL
jgi:hypothetical protein